MNPKDIVTKFEEEFKNKANLNIVDELMADNFIHHALFPGIPAGKEGMKAIGAFVFSKILDIKVTIDFMIVEGDMVADRISARGVKKDSGQAVAWTENHFYKVAGGQIIEWWGEGSAPLS